MPLVPNPMSLSADQFIGFVNHTAKHQSPAPWKVIAVLAPNGRFLSTTKWSFAVNAVGPENHASLTLAPQSIEEQELLLGGAQLQLAVRYETGLVDVLTVQVAA